MLASFAVSKSRKTRSGRSPSSSALWTPSRFCRRSRRPSVSRVSSRIGRPGALTAMSEKYTSAKSSFTMGPATPLGSRGASSAMRFRTS